ncbi:MAG: DUF3806 domain-containing protein [Pseudomonadota bacterium]
MKTRIARTLFSPLLLAFSALAWTAPEVEISDLSRLDKSYMAQQRLLLDDLARSSFGGQLNGQKANDLALLQRLLDDGLVTADQTQELQAMGVIMGDLLAEELDMDWVIYTDQLGRSRALRYRETDIYLFPITMISRRREADNRESVARIYDRASGNVLARREPLPFQ